MKRKLIIVAISCQLLAFWAAGANAQEGIGIQTYAATKKPFGENPFAPGLGFGEVVQKVINRLCEERSDEAIPRNQTGCKGLLLPTPSGSQRQVLFRQSRWVVSLNGYIASPPVIVTFSNGSTGDFYNRDHAIPLEYGASVAYRLSDLNPTPYVFVGYSRFPPGGMSRSIDLVHVGVGLAPFKEQFEFELYPELSVIFPLNSHLIVSQGGNMTYDYPAYVPVMVRATFKFYIDPAPFPAWHGVQHDTTSSKGDGKQASKKTE